MKRKGNRRRDKSNKMGGFLAISVGLVLIGLLVSGMSQFRREDTRRQNAEVALADVTDPEIRYLGMPTNPDGLVLAETGQIDQPTLVWFHADWCHVCQQVKPEVVELGREFEGKVKFVRLDVDDRESQAAVRRYGVRATPTFVLLDTTGEVRGNVPGWPGYQAFVNAFTQLLTPS